MNAPTRTFQRFACLLMSAALCCAVSHAAVTRADLADAYLRVDHAYVDAALKGAALADANREFDRITMMFFTGDFSAAAAALDGLCLTLRDSKQPPNAPMREALSLRALVEPPTFVLGAGGPAPTLRVSRIYPAPERSPTALWAVVRDPSGKAIWKSPLPASPDDGRAVVVAMEGLPPLSPGAHSIEIATAQATLRTASRWYVAATSFDALREELLARLDALEPASDTLRRAVHACAARIRLLADRPSQMFSAQWLTDMHAHAADVRGEVASLEHGEDPYAHRAGDTWLVARLGASDAPLRIYAPAHGPEGEPRPLVIALHGAGGDENMFMDAYGAGALKKLADQHGFIAVSPLNTALADPAAFDDLLVFLRERYAIDAQRVHVVGHSMGAGVAAILARARPGVIASAACIAGPGVYNGGRADAPTLVVAAALDPLIPAARLSASVERARLAGAPVELRVYEDHGHTLIVGDALPGVVGWLMENRLVNR